MGRMGRMGRISLFYLTRMRARMKGNGKTRPIRPIRPNPPLASSRLKLHVGNRGGFRPARPATRLAATPVPEIERRWPLRPFWTGRLRH